MDIKRVFGIAAVSCALVGVAACSEKGANGTASNGSAGTGETSAWLLADAPEGATSVKEAKAAAKEGDVIVVRGRIGGRVAPISADSPVFVIADMELMYCGQATKEDTCPTPWDYCCESPATLVASTATVQLVGRDGEALDVDPVASGLEPLDEVVVVGTVGPRPTGEVLTIMAMGVHETEG